MASSGKLSSVNPEFQVWRKLTFKCSLVSPSNDGLNRAFGVLCPNTWAVWIFNNFHDPPKP